MDNLSYWINFLSQNFWILSIIGIILFNYNHEKVQISQKSGIILLVIFSLFLPYSSDVEGEVENFGYAKCLESSLKEFSEKDTGSDLIQLCKQANFFEKSSDDTDLYNQAR